MGKTKKIIVSIVIFFAVILFNQSAYAMTQEEAGQALASFAIDFYNKYGSETAYSYNLRAQSYSGVTTSGYTDGSGSYGSVYFENKYAFDCVGWISFAVHNCLGLGGEGFTEFGIPPYNNRPGFFNGFELVLGDYNNPTAISEEELYKKARPGDLFLATGQHILLYVGNGYVVDSVGGVPTLRYRKIQGTGYGICAVGRITEEAASGINEDNIGKMFEDSYLDGLEYYGTTEGHYKGTKTVSWLFDNVLGFMDYLFGMLAYIIRAPFVGWANIIENIINDTINTLSGVTVQSTSTSESDNSNDTSQQDSNTEQDQTQNEDTQDSEEQKSDELYKPSASIMYENGGYERINIEDVIYNNVPILDVDFFDVDLSDYKSDNSIVISEDSVIYKLRENVAIWYSVIRSFSIISLLILLIYLGIRLAISTTAGDKAKYKGMLTAWVTSFIIIFMIHYFMIAVIEINDILVDLFKSGELKYSGGVSMYDTIRTRAYSIKLSEGVPATVMYMVLIYFLIRFLFIYVKRYFTVNILALMGPIMAIKYAFDKINTGKSGSLGAWMYDFALNVLLQSVHAILYTVFMAMAFEVGMDSIPGFILALCILNFIFKAEKIFMQVFKFDDRAKSIKDVEENKNYFLEAYKVTRGLVYFPGVAFGVVKNTTKAVGAIVLGDIQIGYSVHNGLKWLKEARKAKASGDEIPEYKPVDVEKVMREKLDAIKSKAATTIDDKLYATTGKRSLRLGLSRMKVQDPNLYEKTKEMLDRNKQLKHEVMKRHISGSVKPIKAMAQIMVGIPMAVVDTESGFTMLATSIGDLGDMSTEKPHYGHRSKKQIRGRRGRIAAIALTGAPGFAYSNAKDGLEQLKKDRKKIAKNEAMLGDLRIAYALEKDIQDELDKIEKELKEAEKDLNEEEKKLIEKDKANAIEQAINSVLNGRNIRGIVSDYMLKNDITKLAESDIEQILRGFNLQNIDREISRLTNAKEDDISKLRSKVEQLKSAIKNGVDEANNPIDVDKARKELDKVEARIESKTKELDIIQKIGQEINNNGELGEAILKNNKNIQNVIKEYKEKNNVKELKDEDASKIKDLFNEKIKNSKVKDDKLDTYATKEEIQAQFNAQDKKGEGLDKKKSVNAILDANFKEGVKNVEVAEKYRTLSDRLRELQTLNQKSINTYGRSVVNMQKIVENIKNNKKDK